MTQVDGLVVDPVPDSSLRVGCLHLLAPHAGRYTIGFAQHPFIGRGEQWVGPLVSR
jgi:hypothetical protein